MASGSVSARLGSEPAKRLTGSGQQEDYVGARRFACACPNAPVRRRPGRGHRRSIRRWRDADGGARGGCGDERAGDQPRRTVSRAYLRRCRHASPRRDHADLCGARPSTRAGALAAWAPLDRMLVETDCPYLTPTPYRGQRNEPRHVAQVARRIADLRGSTLEQLAEATARNSAALFRLPPPPENGD